jgi:hypothetical protein
LKFTVKGRPTLIVRTTGKIYTISSRYAVSLDPTDIYNRKSRARTVENDPFKMYQPAAFSQQKNAASEANHAPVRESSPLFVTDSREPTPEAVDPPAFDSQDPMALMRWKKQQKEKTAAKEAASKLLAAAANVKHLASSATKEKEKQENRSKLSRKATDYGKSTPDAPLSKKFEPSRDVLQEYRSGNPIPLTSARNANGTSINASIPSRPALNTSRKPPAPANTSRTGVHPVKRPSIGSAGVTQRAPTNKVGEPKTSAVDAKFHRRETAVSEATTSKQSKTLSSASVSRADAKPPVRSHKKKVPQDVEPYKNRIIEQKEIIAEKQKDIEDKERLIESLQSEIQQLRSDNRHLQKTARDSNQNKELLELTQTDLDEARTEIRKLKHQVKMARASRTLDPNDSELEAREEEEAERRARSEEAKENEIASLRAQVTELTERLGLKENPYPGYKFIHKNFIDAPLVNSKHSKHRKPPKRGKSSKNGHRRYPVIMVEGGGKQLDITSDSDDGITAVSDEESSEGGSSGDPGSQSSDDNSKPLTKNQRQLKKFDQMVGLPRNPIPTHISGMLAYRDGTRVSHQSYLDVWERTTSLH